MEFEDMFYSSVIGEVGTQDQNRVEDHLTEGSKLIMNPDGTCDIEGSVKITDLELKSLMQITPRIRKVTGDFDCYHNQLTSLEGAPEYVGGNFNCYDNQLTSLEGSPKEVGGDYGCFYNYLCQ